MTQENNAADRAQNFNDVSEETNAAANESFAQDWLNAGEKERAEQANAPARPRLVATLPDWATLSETNGERKSVGGWRGALRSGTLRTTGVAVAAFGLGFFCAAGSWRGETAEQNATEIAAVDEQNDGEKGAFANELGAFDDALTAIDSSTLRSVPNSAAVDFLAQPQGASASATVGGGFANVDAWPNTAGAPNAGAANFGDWPAAQTTASASGEDDSNWRRGVDFQRELTAPVAANATASVDRFPTWNDLGANMPTGAGSLNAPLGTAASVAADVRPSDGVAQNLPVLPGTGVGESAGYAAYNGNAGYQGEEPTNSNGLAPQFAGNSQNSGYNQTNGSENFAGWPTTVSAPATDSASSAPTLAPNYASVAPAPSANFGANAPAPAADCASSAPALAPNYASVAPASNVATEAQRAMVAQLPNENAPAPAANVPAATSNLRW